VAIVGPAQGHQGQQHKPKVAEHDS
jgi:hypothetical protein